MPAKSSRLSKPSSDYEPGFLHMDIKHLPQMPDEQARRYLFVAIDRATRWVFMHIYVDQRIFLNGSAADEDRCV